jgi:hypothetical protein
LDYTSALTLRRLAPRFKAGKLVHRTGVTVSKTGRIAHRITIIAHRIGTITQTIIIQTTGFTIIAEDGWAMKQ